jgi:hypothetical protein
MSKFHDLLQARADVPVGEQQESARKSFPLVVSKSRYNLWSPGQPISTHGNRLLVGVATYAEPDLALLDLLQEAVDWRDKNAPRIDVFNTLDCKSRQDFEKYIPGIGDVFQTPAVGLWQNGVLTDTAWGKPARDLIARVCNLGPSTLEAL